MKITFRDLSFFSTGLIVAFMICMIALEISKPKHEPATLAPMESDETHTGTLHPTTEQVSELLRMNAGDEYVPIKAIYFNEMTQKITVMTDSDGYVSFRQLDLKDIKMSSQ